MSCPREPTRILLVDDHEHVLWGLRKLIDGEWPRMTVTATAKTVSEALAAIRQRKPDMIVLGIVLGNQNSLDHLQEIRKMSGAQILILTDTRDDELHRRAVTAGARAVICKGEPADVLLRHIERANAGHETRHASPC
ncbi:MAG TPA: response regulator transcription factor [Burkholderiales bacterium]|nr:response regulator transcription factor [Burkholderiales bacterium]